MKPPMNTSTLATDRYAVFGHPISHSKSPAIHAAFAAQTGEALSYEAILAPLDDFAGSVRTFVAAGGKGANVTVPFKEEAYRLSTTLSPRAKAAGAVNTLSFTDDGIAGDNTDGAGLVGDLTRNLGISLHEQRILLLGAGGAARGVILPLLGEQPASLVIVNRSPAKAVALADQRDFAELAHFLGCQLDGGSYEDLAAIGEHQFDLVINATSASLSGDLPPLPPGIFAPGALAYDMMYGQGETPFLAFARQQGAARLADGLGMLAEQAAEAFQGWRGVRPDTAAILASLRSS